MPPSRPPRTPPFAANRRQWLRATAAAALAAALPPDARAQAASAPGPMLGDWPQQSAQGLVARIVQRNALPQALVERLIGKAQLVFIR